MKAFDLKTCSLLFSLVLTACGGLHERQSAWLPWS